MRVAPGLQLRQCAYFSIIWAVAMTQNQIHLEV
jgi:hypothetical protein